MPLFIFWIIYLLDLNFFFPFFYCYERSLSHKNLADIIEAFNSTLGYLDDLLNIGTIYFDQMVNRIYPTELQLNRAIFFRYRGILFGFESMYNL